MIRQQQIIFISKKDRVQIETKINHEGEVNKARYMPQRYNIIATKTTNSEIHIFDYHQHPTLPDNDEVKTEMKLKGHDKEGYGLDWNPNKTGYLLSGSVDALINVYDVASENSNPEATFKGHTSVVEDVCWHRKDENLFGSVGDDMKFVLWDRREQASVSEVLAHTAEILSLDFSPLNEFLFLTGSVDNTVALWDQRRLEECVHQFKHHSDEVNSVSFNPQCESVFASGGSDRRVMVWDISKVNDEQSMDDEQDGPPELMFLHGGHTSKVSDIAWNHNEKFMMASVAEDNILQVWQIDQGIYVDEKQ